MRIAQVCPRFPPYTGGIETHVYEISKRLAREFDVEVLSTDQLRTTSSWISQNQCLFLVKVFLHLFIPK